MTRLDDRLSLIEKRVEEIHRLLLHLIAMQGGLPDTSEAGEGEVLPPPPLAPIDATWLEDDPLEIQRQIVLDWAKSEDRGDLSEFQLAGQNLRGVDVSGAVMARANLTRAELTGAKLIKTDLSGGDLSRAQAVRADLSRAVLDEADLTYANLNYAKLESASLRHALLTRANLTGANLSGAELGGAQMNRANLTRANLRDAAVHRKQLTSASSLDGATMPDGRIYDGDPEPWKPQ
jgi:uncharacterized protein YjbI with pentapeptide repeats